MVVHRLAVRAFTFPFRAAWFLIFFANFLPVPAACALVAGFLGYAIALTLSYAFWPSGTTEVLWQWAADFYSSSFWFKAETICLFMLLVLPIPRYWPARDVLVDATHDRETARLNDDLIAARQRGQL
ncbi:Hypothetical protein NGAL_HAMBI1146_07420 [Neorhizobium galegae bv. officinalis]|nr:Hypothetical protein NGAL_HAMBI1146_07420 [Neorhizobium galegae bv. officinalis]